MAESKQIDAIVGKKMGDFEEWLTSRHEPPLSKYEKAIVRTFIKWNIEHKVSRNIVAKKEGG